MYAAVDWRLTQDTMALICITFSVLYFACAGGPTAFRNTFSPPIKDEKLAAKVTDNDEDF